MQISLDFNRAQLLVLEKLGLTKAVYRAMRMAGRDGSRAMNARANRLVRERKRLKVATINKAFKLYPVEGKTIDALKWVVRVKGRPLRVSDYPRRQVRRGVSVAINRDRGRQVIKGAFTARMSSGHVGVFLRMGKDRLPIQQLYTSRITDVLKDERSMPEISKRARTAFGVTYKRVLPLEIKKLKR